MKDSENFALPPFYCFRCGNRFLILKNDEQTIAIRKLDVLGGVVKNNGDKWFVDIFYKSSTKAWVSQRDMANQELSPITEYISIPCESKENAEEKLNFYIQECEHDASNCEIRR